MATRKKKTTAKKVRETRYTVKKSRDNASTPDDTEQTIHAKNIADAAAKSAKQDPRAGQHDEVVIKKDVGGAGAPRTEPDTVSKVKPTGLESVSFPYYLGLPMGFKPLFESLTKKVRENLVIGTRYGKIHIQVSNVTTMAGLITEVEKKARGRTKMKHMAAVVANGINESVKK
jgi:hypothetical protein